MSNVDASTSRPMHQAVGNKKRAQNLIQSHPISSNLNQPAIGIRGESSSKRSNPTSIGASAASETRIIGPMNPQNVRPERRGNVKTSPNRRPNRRNQSSSNQVLPRAQMAIFYIAFITFECPYLLSMFYCKKCSMSRGKSNLNRNVKYPNTQ